MILFIDDEKRHVSVYIEELRFSGYSITYRERVDEAVPFFTEQLAKIDMVIMDIMMPAGQSFKDKETRYGLDTGLRLYEWVRERAPTLPVIILTNVTNEEVARRFGGEQFCWFLQKSEHSPTEVVNKVNEVLDCPTIG